MFLSWLVCLSVRIVQEVTGEFLEMLRRVGLGIISGPLHYDFCAVLIQIWHLFTFL